MFETGALMIFGDGFAMDFVNGMDGLSSRGFMMSHAGLGLPWVSAFNLNDTEVVPPTLLEHVLARDFMKFHMFA